MQAGESEVPIVEDLTISLARANTLVGIMTLPLVGLLLVLYRLLSLAVAGRADSPSLGAVVALLVAVLPGIFVHEAIHGAAWRAFGRLGRGRVEFGFQRRTLTPYAHALDPMPAAAYRLGAVLPALLLGVAPYAAGIVLGNLPLALFGILFIAAAGGDFLVLWLLRNVSGRAMVQDHPSRAGCIVLPSSGEGTQSVQLPDRRE
jgi:hypothetical protein